MRVIAGEAKGARLTVPKGPNVRPTLDRVRESLFNMLGDRVPGARFLDLYAGSGANGIEALSRGADHAVFVDKDIRFVRDNLRKTRLNGRAECVKANLPGGIGRLEDRAPFHIVFADPPFKLDNFAHLLDLVAQTRLLASEGIIVLEHSSRLELQDRLGPYAKNRERVYGETQLTFYLDAPPPIC
jgi:16S rRNA (guanine(966)-N(2))-methyltransferase RsmD